MGMVDQVTRDTGRLTDDTLAAIGAVVDEARAGKMSEGSALEAVKRIMRRHDIDQPVYQKPWG